MLVEDWDAVPLGRQEAAMGGRKGSRAPLGQHAEFDPVDLTWVVAGKPAISVWSHVALSNATNAGTAILSCRYSFVDGSDGSARRRSVFITYERNPETRFAPLQRNRNTSQRRSPLSAPAQRDNFSSG